VKVVFDRGFYSKGNIDALFKGRQKFIIGAKLSLKYVKDALEEERDGLKRWSNLQAQFGTYGAWVVLQQHFQ
jgi:transposase